MIKSELFDSLIFPFPFLFLHQILNPKQIQPKSCNHVLITDIVFFDRQRKILLTQNKFTMRYNNKKEIGKASLPRVHIPTRLAHTHKPIMCYLNPNEEKTY